ncbi:MAG: 30S ribosomal protein S9 [Nitrospirae bacterium GWF2_44_13]|jgi:small subunit ribosomal protein S9|nr:30S ribosomal protein S9 [Nitrospirota bacterium]MDP1759494.1 30S ribosomal protein S9 [Thermodesulfovibrionales bacterium]OGW30763.1 MAG: 30S ribosomal protein S9 [Nitrospirae bacterium GWF2_44_13]OGW35508.1 MAG: 30S ribosomal protein S9 [Nitrospirae bacterium GWD2_44_7]OGW66129.1 MAG: 30S ribosomal protein S9 [Nitrospirae bacterium RIFOXYA2_FULL_44_9]OGW74248.1 MAG: 30S ribosomal protein S9 [Nitrospirae bacterium RIFOXYC2_FULL_44_7]HBG92079.1 30S ribosomal protein S9 [Nitrospiraceae bact
MAEIKHNATGRRKSSIASVSMSPGNGRIVVNEKPLDSYFARETLQMMIRQPLELTGMSGKYNITAKVVGGGLSGQAGALRHGISRAILSIDNDLRLKLKKEGFLTRDPRETERKKYGQKGARKRFQFSKR